MVSVKVRRFQIYQLSFAEKADTTEVSWEDEGILISATDANPIVAEARLLEKIAEHKRCAARMEAH